MNLLVLLIICIVSCAGDLVPPSNITVQHVLKSEYTEEDVIDQKLRIQEACDECKRNRALVCLPCEEEKHILKDMYE